MLFNHPEVATRSCDNCKKWVYGRDGQIEQRRGLPVIRTGPTPCWDCPKKSPKEAPQFELTQQNKGVVSLYLKSQATGGQCLTVEQKTDDGLLRKLAIAFMAYDIQRAKQSQPRM